MIWDWRSNESKQQAVKTRLNSSDKGFCMTGAVLKIFILMYIQWFAEISDFIVSTYFKQQKKYSYTSSCIFLKHTCLALKWILKTFDKYILQPSLRANLKKF